MDANTCSPFDLFASKAHYVIPPFQRPYVWTEEHQWAPLWEDIRRVSESLMAAAASGAEDEGIRHFLGAVVYESKKAVAGKPSMHDVIDGQQRMTTLQILIDAARGVIGGRVDTADPDLRGEYEDQEEALHDLVANSAKSFAGTDLRFKLLPSRADREAFKHAMDPQVEFDGEHRILDAHDYFTREVDRWLAGVVEEGEDPVPGTEGERVHALSETLQHRLTLVTIDLSGHDDSQLIFETLNDRGTPLLKADLIKNWVFRRGTDLGADVDAWARKYWAEFDDDWWREEVSRGRQMRSRIDNFLQYWLTMRMRTEVKTDHAFRAFEEYAGPLMATPMDGEAFLKELRKDADLFRSFDQLDAETTTGRFYRRVIEGMEAAATIPVFMYFASPNHGIPEEQVERGLGALESWVIRRTLLRMTSKDINRLVLSGLKAIDGGSPESSGVTLAEFLAGQDAESRVWPSDDDVRTQLPGAVMYYNVKQSRLRVVFAALEQHLRESSPFTEAVKVPDWLQIEHIMPRAWRTHWDDPALDDEQAAERDGLVNTLGNLTVITQSLNSSLSNRPWTDDKAEGLREGGRPSEGKWSLLNQHSLLLLNKEILEHTERWTDEDIRARGRRLAELVCQTWPIPA
ncbi:DUF262 domain-containing protein [Micrococcus luteus]|uniref:DUF262 domain-containing protein n=1 Tax=Micrococcus luteus TaxID=1270 RepID=UPI003424E3F1